MAEDEQLPIVEIDMFGTVVPHEWIYIYCRHCGGVCPATVKIGGVRLENVCKTCLRNRYSGRDRYKVNAMETWRREDGSRAGTGIPKRSLLEKESLQDRITTMRDAFAMMDR